MGIHTDLAPYPDWLIASLVHHTAALNGIQYMNIRAEGRTYVHDHESGAPAVGADFNATRIK